MLSTVISCLPWSSTRDSSSSSSPLDSSSSTSSPSSSSSLSSSSSTIELNSMMNDSIESLATPLKGFPLPIETVFHILSFIDNIHDIRDAMLVCKSWYLLLNDNYAWRRLSEEWLYGGDMIATPTSHWKERIRSNIDDLDRLLVSFPAHSSMNSMSNLIIGNASRLPSLILEELLIRKNNRFEQRDDAINNIDNNNNNNNNNNQQQQHMIGMNNNININNINDDTAMDVQHDIELNHTLIDHQSQSQSQSQSQPCVIFECGRSIRITSMEDLASLSVWCASGGRVRFLERLIESFGVRLIRQCIDMEYRTPFYHAAKHGHLSILKLLYEWNACDIDQARDTNATPLYIACQEGHFDIVQMLVSLGADMNKSRFTGATPLFIASQYGHEDIVHLLITQNINVNVSRHDRVTPLYIACESGNTECVRLLLNANATPDIGCSGGFPINSACREGHLEIVKMLVGFGASIDGSMPPNNISNVYLAVKFRRPEVLEYLLSQRAGVDQPTTYGTTPLQLAASQGFDDIVQILLAHGADASISLNGVTALELARVRHHEAVIRVLEEHLERASLSSSSSSPPVSPRTMVTSNAVGASSSSSSVVASPSDPEVPSHH